MVDKDYKVLLVINVYEYNFINIMKQCEDKYAALVNEVMVNKVYEF